ncbi:MAG: carboxypeptidase regulatory-like domain-containing protein, partial [Prevotellaceae bacterium]|nr:carboxypeptidase regulatory-like domain-containing protein [Prevotellaceae bacterium]
MLFFVLFLSSLAAAAQQNVSGKVVNAKGLPVVGATVTVTVAGSTVGTATDVHGEYSLYNVPPEATLVFTYGRIKREEKVQGRAAI